MTHDVIVIGGGAAGLAGATALLRSRRSVLVVDGGEPRNAPADGVHNFLTREGTPPGELLAAGRAEVLGYGGEVVRGNVVEVEPGFRVRLDDGRTESARRLLVATGLVDELPEVPGLAQRWGRDVLHCPFCHGWEVRDRAVGVLAAGPMAVHQALLFRQLTDDLTLFLHTGPDLSEEEWEQLAALGVAVVDGEVAGLEVVDDRLAGVRLVSGRTVAREVLVVAPRFTARVPPVPGLVAQEVRMGEHVIGSAVPVGPRGATAVPGVWAAGNVTDVQTQVIGAAAAGLAAGAAINADLVAEDARRAVAGDQAGRDGAVKVPSSPGR
ncbi:thioredoxin reductase [Pseudonocardia hierapolitana]|uniref:Thioredoxin reductase n=1 Tax=Pseudonocardia hierapolitana TaxID=1128676 RepID=A0A561ST31_9PSEU|nr:NAD(P)/FAD-dependent oxidoreductase [Pseudonocardia hierapolitana]TWF78027.1 thioredoxin reductase [Pseudonocardia hierapolitana]